MNIFQQLPGQYKDGEVKKTNSLKGRSYDNKIF